MAKFNIKTKMINTAKKINIKNSFLVSFLVVLIITYNYEEVNRMKKKNRIIAIVALVLIAAMVVTSVVSAFIM